MAVAAAERVEAALSTSLPVDRTVRLSVRMNSDGVRPTTFLFWGLRGMAASLGA